MKMFKRILGIILLSTVAIFTVVSQTGPAWTAPTQFQNGQNYGDIRNAINTNATNGWTRDQQLRDSITRHLAIMTTIYGRLNVIEDSVDAFYADIVAILAGGGGGGGISSVGNGLTLSSGALTFGGTLSASTSLIYGAYTFSDRSAASAPAGTDDYAYFIRTKSLINGATEKYSAGVLGTYSKFYFPSTGYWDIDGIYGASSLRTRVYTDANGLHLYAFNDPGFGSYTRIDITSIGARYATAKTFTNDRDIVDKGYVDQLNDTIIVQILCTLDALTVGGTNTGYVLAVSDDLAGCTLIKVEARSGEPGTGGVVNLDPYRKRGASSNRMTSTTATLTTDATINPAYDDLASGDVIYIMYSEIGASVPTESLFGILTFVR